MQLTRVEKPELRKPVRLHDKDTGSPEVQITLLTERIRQLTEHFKTHRFDFHSRHGLQKMVNLRKKLLKYLKEKDRTRYTNLIKHLELRDSY